MQRSGQQSITVEDSMAMVHASSGKLKPASPFLRSEPAIVAGIAHATLTNSKTDWLELVADYDRIRDRIEQTLPGFENFNARIRVPGGFRMPLPPTERVWPTATGKAMFSLFDGVTENSPGEGENVLRLVTLRSHDQYNTTIYALDDRYRGVFGRRDVLFMNEEDMQQQGLEHGDRVDITTALPDSQQRLDDITVVAYSIAPGTVAAYYPEANVLAPLNYLDKESGTPSYKSVPVQITLRSKEIRPL
jgi:anaerobic selenocysteine-containing dehydrogenase